MTSTPPLSVSSMAHELLDRWEHFLQTERTAFSIPDLNPDSPLFGTMADLDLLSRDSIAWAIEQGWCGNSSRLAWRRWNSGTGPCPCWFG